MSEKKKTSRTTPKGTGKKQKPESKIIRITHDDKSWDFALDSGGPKEARMVRVTTGMAWAEWLQTMTELKFDIDTFAVLEWVARIQNGETVTLDEVDENLSYDSKASLEWVELEDSVEGEVSAGS